MRQKISEAIKSFHTVLSKISDISQIDLELIVPIVTIEHYPKGTFFIEPGASSQKMAILLSGLVKTFYIAEDGKEFITHFGKEGSFIGVYTDMLKNVPSTGYIQTLEPCTFMVMNYRELLNVTKSSLAWAHLIRSVAESRYIYRSEMNRLLTTQSASDRYVIFAENHPDLLSRIPQNQIALYLNLTPATLSRLKNGSGNYKK